MYKRMTKLFITSLFSISMANTFAADIPYCKGTKVGKSKNHALQNVVKKFAAQNDCQIGDNCLRNFAKIKYAIAWSEPCNKSAAKYNDPLGSTFICEKGLCLPYGFFQPAARYK